MIGCLFTAQLDDKLNAQEKSDVLEKVKKTKGVFSAQFAKAASKKDDVIAVHAGMPGIAKEIEKIPGVISTKMDPRRLM
jgi:hypothetical protein